MVTVRCTYHIDKFKRRWVTIFIFQPTDNFKSWEPLFLPCLSESLILFDTLRSVKTDIPKFTFDVFENFRLHWHIGWPEFGEGKSPGGPWRHWAWGMTPGRSGRRSPPPASIQRKPNDCTCLSLSVSKLLSRANDWFSNRLLAAFTLYADVMNLKIKIISALGVLPADTFYEMDVFWTNYDIISCKTC